MEAKLCSSACAMKAQRGSRGNLYSFFNLGAVWSVPCPGYAIPGNDPAPIM